MENLGPAVPAEHWTPLRDHIADAIWHKSKLEKKECVAKADACIQLLTAPLRKPHKMGPEVLAIKLQSWANSLFGRYGAPVYLVGSSLNGGGNDVDIRIILPYDEYYARWPKGHDDPAWALEMGKQGRQGAKWASANVDLQVQNDVEVIEYKDKPRLRLDTAEAPAPEYIPTADDIFGGFVESGAWDKLMDTVRISGLGAQLEAFWRAGFADGKECSEGTDSSPADMEAVKFKLRQWELMFAPVLAFGQDNAKALGIGLGKSIPKYVLDMLVEKAAMVSPGDRPLVPALDLGAALEALEDAIIHTNNMGQGWEINGEKAVLVPHDELRTAIDAVKAPPASPPSGTALNLEALRPIGEAIRTQDNRITEQPIFLVQQKRRIWGPDAEGRYVWKDGDWMDATEVKAEELDAADEAGESTKGYTKAYYEDIWVFVTACFTEKGCQDYIAKNGHNLNEPRIYADGSYRNEEWRTVRNFLESLPSNAATGEASNPKKEGEA